MSREDPSLQRYRRIVMVFVLSAGAVAVGVGAFLLWKGYVFYALLAMAVLAYLVLVLHGYRQDEEERR